MSVQIPIWRAPGVEPPEELKINGWQPGMKPSAQHINWLFHELSKEAQKAGVTVEDLLSSTSAVNALSANQGRILNNKLTTIEESVTQHLAEMAIHNQFMDGAVKKQISFGVNNELGCLTINISEVI
ncbi:hypothetical protein [Lysinibacillus sp. 54212]|uniref:hypothetical protein n=1 Tax=Lysinibacillus sp. 54212 TaxID=3119829 RepID=UPI002FC6A6B5